MSQSQRCPLCDGTLSADRLIAREMMFGTRERFQYGQCGECGTLILLEVPADLLPYYPSDYYSFTRPASPESHTSAPWFRRARSNLLLRLPIAFADRLVVAGRAPPFFSWFAGRRTSTDSSVLDVGSGSGKVLLQMARHGFTNLVGVDPYLEEGRSIGPVQLQRQTVDELVGKFDVAMLNHVLEHMAEPRAVLAALRDRLEPEGTLVIRTPAADSWAAQHYGAEWVQLDAPRHLVLPTEAGMAAAAKASGLRVWRSFRDSGALQFWGSEQYLLDIPLRDARSWAEDPDGSSFNQAKVDAWEVEAKRLNQRRQGDSAVFVIARA